MTYTRMMLCCFFLLTVSANAKTFEGVKNNVPQNNKALQFIRNAGQVIDQDGKLRTDIDARISNSGVTMFVGDGQLHYQWTKTINESVPVRKHPLSFDKLSDADTINTEIEIYRLDVVLVGADTEAEVVFEHPTGYYENYYLAHTGEDGITASGYAKVVYKNIYPNIDWVLYAKTGSDKETQNPAGVIKYDFIVHPGGNPADIKFRYQGATNMVLADGMLTATTPFGSISDDAPVSYNLETGKPVASKFILEDNTLRFEVGSYDGTLVIDPTFKWGTYYGGSQREKSEAVATAFDGSVAISGYTSSTENLATTGAHLSTKNTTYMAFVAKFSNKGARLWATYYGGANADISAIYCSNIACDNEGNIYMTATCNSDTAIATVNAHQTKMIIPFGFDPYIVKFNGNGKRLWATLYGGSGFDYITGVVCDNDNNVYICGNTTSQDSIATKGAFQATISNYGIGFLAKFNASGVRQWGTYYGLGGLLIETYFLDVATDSKNNVYVCGTTEYASYANYFANGAHQSVYGGGTGDGILVKFSNNGQRLLDTYYGGSRGDVVTALVCDADDNLYVTGRTNSSNNIATTNAQSTTLPGSLVTGFFLAKFNSAGVRQWGTYLGGFSSPNLITMGGIEISVDKKVYVWNTTVNDIDIIDEFSFLGISNGITSVGFAGTAWQHHAWGGNKIAVSHTGQLYFVGTTNNSSGLRTNGGYQPTYRGNDDAYLAAFNIDSFVYVEHPFTDTLVCPGDILRLPYGTTSKFKSGNKFTAQLSDATGSFSNPTNIGNITAVESDTIVCVIPFNTTAGAGYRIRVKATSPIRTSWDNSFDININKVPAAFASNVTNPVCAEDTLKLKGTSTSTDITWQWTGPNGFAAATKDTLVANALVAQSGRYILSATLNSSGCALKDTVDVVVKPRPVKPVAFAVSPVCETKPINLTVTSSTTGVSYSWAGPNGYNSTSQNNTLTAAMTHNGGFVATASLDGCSKSDTVDIIVLPKPARPSASAINSPLCATQDLQLAATSVTGVSYNWYGPGGYLVTGQNPVRYNIQLNQAGKYFLFAALNGCLSDTDSVNVVVNTDPIVNIFPTPGNTICKGQQVIFTALPTNGGTVSYKWYVNNTAASNTASYSTTSLNNGDKVHCLMTSVGTCSTPFIDTSIDIQMNVLALKQPKAAVTADAGPSLFSNQPVNFTAVVKDGGSLPAFQWRLNGKNIDGATGSIWGANANSLNDGDNICVWVKSNYQCPDPDTALSNCIKLNIRLGVEQSAIHNKVKIYPNPAKERINIDGAMPGAVLQLYDIVGRMVYSTTLQTEDGIIDMSTFAEGNYVLKTTIGGTVDWHKVTIIK